RRGRTNGAARARGRRRAATRRTRPSPSRHRGATAGRRARVGSRPCARRRPGRTAPWGHDAPWHPTPQGARGARAPGPAAGRDLAAREARRALPRGPRAETAAEVSDVVVPALAQEAGRGVPALARGAAHDDAARGDLGVPCTELV